MHLPGPPLSATAVDARRGPALPLFLRASLTDPSASASVEVQAVPTLRVASLSVWGKGAPHLFGTRGRIERGGERRCGA
jgi:hypothetical protein